MHLNMLSSIRKQGKQNEHFLNIELPVTAYEKARIFQHKLVAARQEKTIIEDLILWLEHPPVFTLGRHAGLNNLLVEPFLLRKKGIDVVRSERGGDITYHGPGQLIGYPIFDMEAARLDVPQYILCLETVMVRTARDFGIEAKHRKNYPGVWVDNNKIGSIGIAISKGVAFHGFALNVNLDLTPFEWIHPCGLETIRISSFKKELSTDVNPEEVREKARFHMASIFGKETVMIKKDILLESILFN
jgi:lipoate-protein ligase B